MWKHKIDHWWNRILNLKLPPRMPVLLDALQERV